MGRLKRSVVGLGLLSFIGCAGIGCAGFMHGRGELPATALVAAETRPVLFLGAEPAAAQIGFVSDQTVLTLTGPLQLGRVPVRIDGALRTRGYVAADQLSLRVQRRGRVRGTPVYVGPGDLVRVLGPDVDDKRLRVVVTPRLGERALGRYEGSYPAQGLSASAAASTAERPEPGSRFRVPAGLVVPLFEAPGKTGAAPLAELSAQPAPYEVAVLRAVDGWLAVRAGSGPYLVGWTQAALTPVPADAGSRVASTEPTATGTSPLPRLLADEPGELRQVASGTKVMFGQQVIGVFKRTGLARVQRVFESGFVDVFAAADDGVALRGVVRKEDLSELPALSERSTTAAARSPAPASAPAGTSR